MHAVELVWHRSQALCKQSHLGGVDRQLARAGAKHMPDHPHDVAQIPVLEALVDIGANFLGLDVDLDARRTVLQGRETGLAHDPFEHHASCNADMALQRSQFLGAVRCMFGKQCLGVISRLEIVGKGNALAISLPLADELEFFASLGDQLVFVGDGQRVRLVRHGISGFRDGNAGVQAGQQQGARS